ncbi:DUF188 domain-containing protein [bacterium (Candidatus Blackallbacteria) CG17_big_fil_post_rev_8_21_14_2_50_48_46]|uniref:UPF0178 protein COW36_15770 n=1 Tax=bacterium (Candidatus Blackallbacteria) CG17_big_fil_post_rev_8_21_14_2_50_48_46 TaxID=2014261 RepID=A0A2M7G209_9BACT|nr:MAG: DUF188 domain-containing protein [bacterium (Candidatus Blackallbacteria) CG18_big_fil_WC_8_21_14_2_50_49_26]PIW15803.1 MAG: DUF188 domain-containing protein [bacterium (Candidatus Blackallbacteria) CG17_big_fil_post_rev_8_21_14_2_50_48_46]PIW47788.1 MAG: DUF188 domain-containing protein [bacterium (Candidatus Blackallbacteria) CG13_big_fil_rev_8_21_14_2_50_49_14]
MSEDSAPPIWVDADACPKPVKEILYRACQRHRRPLILVANMPLNTPQSPWISTLQVEAGVDVADNAIAERVQAGELVISADIPLAADVVAKGALCLNPRGTLYTRDNIHHFLSMRNLFDELRSSEEIRGGPKPFSHKDRMAFANQLEKVLRR